MPITSVGTLIPAFTEEKFNIATIERLTKSCKTLSDVFIIPAAIDNEKTLATIENLRRPRQSLRGM